MFHSDGTLLNPAHSFRVQEQLWLGSYCYNLNKSEYSVKEREYNQLSPVTNQTLRGNWFYNTFEHNVAHNVGTYCTQIQKSGQFFYQITES